ncbi:uncharacterized protein EDB93DRAFT_1250550 [Suillus bovinus]|uniref:uncharacterized protein n=1 Tax=Suillus bovinus TaxID=48563 RepID=UPI001B87F7CD|nr:uncharacterized protein EDB93DRAFT_1250550 [Suillus bovinus]KAG2147410.1 hypothetical protein EDB93DRAFT_1250550 [Suillus bovinus]
MCLAQLGLVAVDTEDDPSLSDNENAGIDVLTKATGNIAICDANEASTPLLTITMMSTLTASAAESNSSLITSLQVHHGPGPDSDETIGKSIDTLLESYLNPLNYNAFALKIILLLVSSESLVSSVLQEHLDAWAPTIFLLILLVSALASHPYPNLALVIFVILVFPFALYLSLQQSQYIWPDPFTDEAYPCSVLPPD